MTIHPPPIAAPLDPDPPFPFAVPASTFTSTPTSPIATFTCNSTCDPHLRLHPHLHLPYCHLQTFVTAYWSASAVMVLLLLSGAVFGGAALAGLSDLATIFWLFGFEAADAFLVSSGIDRSADPEYMLQLGGAACLYTTGVHLLLLRALRLQNGWGVAGGAACIASRLAFAAASVYALLSKQGEQERCWESLSSSSVVTTIIAAAARDALFCGVMVGYSLAWIRTQLVREAALKTEEEAAARMSEDLVLLEGLTGGGHGEPHALIPHTHTTRAHTTHSYYTLAGSPPSTHSTTPHATETAQTTQRRTPPPAPYLIPPHSPLPFPPTSPPLLQPRPREVSGSSRPGQVWASAPTASQAVVF